MGQDISNLLNLRSPVPQSGQKYCTKILIEFR